MTALLALASALLVGGADFVGGTVSRRASPVRLAAVAQLLGIVLVIPLALVTSWTQLRPADVAWSLASGLAVGAGLAVFYSAMARGLISVVAPVTAVTGASVPVVFALARGERPGGLALVGITGAIVAIALVSLGPSTESGGVGVITLAVCAGALFGLFFAFLSLPDEDAGLWPVAFSRIGSSAALVVLALALTRGLQPGRQVTVQAGVIAVLESSAAVFLLVALQRGPVSVASVLASLYPVTTTVLAAAVLGERLGRIQLVGVALALVAVVLVSLA